MLRYIWTAFCYLWAGAIVIGVVLLLRSDDSITPTVTDFVVIFGVALAPMVAPPVVRALYRHLASPAEPQSDAEPNPEDDS